MQILPIYKAPKSHYLWGEIYSYIVVVIGIALFFTINHVNLDQVFLNQIFNENLNSTLANPDENMNINFSAIIDSEDKLTYWAWVILGSFAVNFLICFLGLFREINYHKRYHKTLGVYSKDQLITGILHQESKPKEINIVLKHLRKLEKIAAKKLNG